MDRVTPEPPARPGPPESLTVLVVDDQDLQRIIVRRALAKLGHTVLEAASAEAALALLATRVVDVVLSDWVMDGMDGTDLCRQLRQDSAHRTVHFILMSSRDSSEDLQAGREAGADEFLCKPLDVQDLGVRMRAVQAALAARANLQGIRPVAAADGVSLA